MPRFQVPVPPLPTAVPLPSQYLSAPAAADGMANRIRALRDALLSKRPDNSLLCFSAFGRAAVIIFPNHWPRKACAQQNWSERVSISQIDRRGGVRSEEHTSELQSLMRTSYAVFCLNTKKEHQNE